MVHLPIADLSINIFTIFGLGLAVGFVSGMFGVGGGFLMTPFLILLGIPTAVAVASASSHMAASSFSGALNYWRKRSIDIPMAMVLLTGGLAGSLTGVWIFTLLQRLGQLELFINLSYLILLGCVGVLMLIESTKAIMRSRRGDAPVVRKGGTHHWAHRLPGRMRFKRSRIYVSVFPVCGVGFAIGVAGSVMGIGGGFLLVPILIYYFRMPTATVIGTAAVLTTTTMALALMTQALVNHLVDAVLAIVLMIGGVVGAQFGANASHRMRAERLRFLLGLIVLGVGFRIGYELIVPPGHIYFIRSAVTEP